MGLEFFQNFRWINFASLQLEFYENFHRTHKNINLKFIFLKIIRNIFRWIIATDDDVTNKDGSHKIAGSRMWKLS